MDSITTQERTTGRSRINDEILILYNYESVNNVPIEKLNATIRKNEIVVGYFNSSRSGESGLTFSPGNDLSVEEKQIIASRLYQDEDSVFNPTEAPTDN